MSPSYKKCREWLRLHRRMHKLRFREQVSCLEQEWSYMCNERTLCITEDKAHDWVPTLRYAS